ncbi:hypothetical protein FK529_19485 [Tsukamurella asaccharolytica]|uniref:Uncharacterized protein n=1 Tax=Tsukamurella asaccharolytica TaxID=2592067 RepID=A0A5C5R300_9ACTN|nr:hypothetical protein [Tsukamurella asaccharolytica]TWS17657.1 hypothetical protein FK529_19485 [Tsukamurella asaccharolytica]
MLLDVENSPGVTCTVLDKGWPRGQFHGEPTSVKRRRLQLDRAAGTFSLLDIGSRLRTEIRYAPETGYQLVHGDEPTDLPGDMATPPAVQLLNPSQLGIWGRGEDPWRIASSALSNGEILVRAVHKFSANSRAEIAIDLGVRIPVRWTTEFEASGVKSEIELTDIELDGQWSFTPWELGSREREGVLGADSLGSTGSE